MLVGIPSSMNFGFEKIPVPISWTDQDYHRPDLALDVARLFCIQQIEESVGLETHQNKQNVWLSVNIGYLKILRFMWFITIFTMKTGHNQGLIVLFLEGNPIFRQT